VTQQVPGFEEVRSRIKRNEIFLALLQKSMCRYIQGLFEIVRERKGGIGSRIEVEVK
jgi:hypothetical protein